jgi:hypothetical protein
MHGTYLRFDGFSSSFREHMVISLSTSCHDAGGKHTSCYRDCKEKNAEFIGMHRDALPHLCENSMSCWDGTACSWKCNQSVSRSVSLTTLTMVKWGRCKLNIIAPNPGTELKTSFDTRLCAFFFVKEIAPLIQCSFQDLPKCPICLFGLYPR